MGRSRSRVTDDDSNIRDKISRVRSRSRGGETQYETMRLNQIVKGKHVLDGQVMIEVETNNLKNRTKSGNPPLKSVQTYLQRRGHF